LLLLLAGVFVIGVVTTKRDMFPARQVVAVLSKVSAAAGGGGPQPNPEGYHAKLQKKFAECVESDVEADTSELYTVKCEDALLFPSPRLGAEITVMQGVFNPFEAEWIVLPVMGDNSALFKGARVMEIGTGSGIISLYAAKLGASKVVATDINPQAIASIRLNAKDLGFADVIDARLVPLDDMSAYSVIAPDEQFDIIISNPPFALDLDAAANSALTDRGDLGFSIVRGLDEHLAPNGKAIFLYGSLFYHQVMAKFGRYRGYTVRNHNPNGMFPWAAESLFNSYLGRLLDAEGIPRDAFRFDRTKDYALTPAFLTNGALQRPYEGQLEWEPLFPAPAPNRYHPGMMVMERPE
jgi:SAM-dependent methyltransferase